MEKAENLPIRAWLEEHWRAILALMGALVLLALVTFLAARTPTHPWVGVSVLWPDELSETQPTRLPIVVDGSKDFDAAGARAELYVYPVGDSKDRFDIPYAVTSGELDAVAETTLGEGGSGVLEIPPRPATTDHTPVLVLKLTSDGDELWYEHPLERAAGMQAAVSLDRPLYQPGQTMKMRAVAVASDSGRPVDVEVAWEVRDPKNNVVLSRTTPTGPNGVAHTELTLAERCLQGDYNVRATVGGEATTKTVEVRPFRLPRFKVAVVPPEKPVTAGERARGRVEARYTYGEPVAGASVDVRLEGSNAAISGVTNEDGLMDFELLVPPTAASGADMTVRAVVTSSAGRAEAGTAVLRAAERRLSVEIVPADGAFVWSRSRPGWVIVQYPDGEPAAGAKVDLSLPENDGQREVELTTDEAGRAPFDWTPTHGAGSTTLSYRVRAKGPLQTGNAPMTVVDPSAELRVSASRVEAGSKIDVQAYGGAHRMVALVRGTRTHAAAPVPEGPQLQTVSLDVPPDAAGLARVVVLDAGGIPAQRAVWVEQPGGDTVRITADAPEYEPGTQAQVELEFPPQVRGGPAPEGTPVTFGLVGVDEALYALAERADVPLPVLLRDAPEAVGGALAVVDGVDPRDEAAVAIASYRFHQRTQSMAPVQRAYPNSITSEVELVKARGRLLFVMLVWLAGLFASVVLMVRATWRAASRDVFSWRRALAMGGFILLCALVAGGLGAAGRRGEALFGGGIVWMLVVGAWLFAAMVRAPGQELRQWLALHVLGSGFMAGAAVCVAQLSPVIDFEDVFMVGGVVLPIGITAIQHLVWAFALMHRGETQAGLGLGSVVGAGLLGSLGIATFSAGAQYEMVAKSAAPMMEEPSMPTQMAPPAQAGSPAPDAGGAAAAEGAPRVRSWFPETMVWLPELASDAAGKARVTLELPDSITTWRLDAWANTWDGRFGQGTTSLLAIRPYFVEVDLPTHVTDGDVFEVPVSLHNRGNDPLRVDLQARTTGGLRILGASEAQRDLDGGERKVVWLRVAAAEVGAGSLLVSSRTEEGVPGDAAEQSLQIAADGRTIRTSASAIVGDGWEHTPRLPRDVLSGTLRSDVRVFPSLVADAMAGLESMLRQPGGCFEQTSSANYPNVMVLRALRGTKPADWPGGDDEWRKAHERAEELVSLGYQRILTFQTSEGGFALYPGQSPDVMLTAYGLMQLTAAREVFAVDEAVVARAVEWLRRQRRSDNTWSSARGGLPGGQWGVSDDVGATRATAFVVLAVSGVDRERYRDLVDPAAAVIESRLDMIESSNALALAANALWSVGKKEGATRALDRLASFVVRDGDLAWWTDEAPSWMGATGRYSSRETTAIVARALFDTQSHAELVQPVLNFVARERGPWGGWGSTQATVWTLRALEALRAKNSERSELTFTWDGAALGRGSDARPAPSTLVVEAASPLLQQFSFVPGSPSGSFAVRSSASSAAMIQLVTEYAVDWESRWADLEEEPFSLDLRLEGSRELAAGRPVNALVELRNDRNTPSAMVIVEAPVPPGAFVPTESLDQLVQTGAIDMFEVLPTHVRFYVPTVDSQSVLVLPYRFVPLVRGTMSLPAVRAYPFYNPEPTAEADAGDVRVSRSPPAP